MSPSEVAIKYIGQTEKPGNMGFNDEEFEAKMKAVGFKRSHAWCAYFAELVFKEAYPEKFKELDKLFSASAVKTYKNFRDAGYPMHNTPEKDCLVIWQMHKNGKPQWQGHAGIVVRVEPNNWIFESVEGNTNDGGGREGYIVAMRSRRHLAKVDNGLKVLGFISFK